MYSETIENGYYGCWMGGRSNRLLRHEHMGEVVQNLHRLRSTVFGI